ncbi:hypothetical protein Tco_0485338 [Tanacetum coccineum]
MEKNPKLNVNSTSPVLSARSYPVEDPQCSARIYNWINAITIYPKKPSKPHDDKPGENEIAKTGATDEDHQRNDLVMSDSDESGVTYTEVSSPFEGLSDIGSPRADDHEYLELPWMPEDPYVEAALQAPPSPDYVPGPEEPEQAPPSPDYDPEEDPTDYPADGGDDGDDEDEPSNDDEDEKVDIEADDEEGEEHPAPADSTTVALLAADQAPSTEETEPFKTGESAATPPPHPAYRITARISILALVLTPDWSDAEIPSPLLPLILSPLPVSSPVHVLYPSPPASHIHPLGYRAVMIWLRVEAASTSHSLPLPPPIILSHTRPDAPSSGTPPLHLLSTGRREDIPEVTLPPRKRLGVALGPRYEIGESSSAAAARPAGGLRADYGFVATMDRKIRHDLERDVGYGIIDSWDEIVEAMQGIPVVTNVAEFSQRMTDFETRVRQDTNKVYTRDRRAHACTARLMETEAKMSREAWGRFMDASDLARAEVMSLRTTVQLTKALKLVKRLQTQMVELQRHQGPANGLAQPELPEEAGSSS